MNEENGRTVRVKRLQIGTRVSGAIGDFIQNDPAEAGGPKKRRRRQRVVGTIIEACEHNKYRLIVDGTDRIIEAPSCQLRVESTISTTPPDLPVVPNPREQIEDEIELANQEPDEDLPQLPPEAEDAAISEASDHSDDEQVNNPDGDEPAPDGARTPYETVKQRALDHIHSLVGKKIVERKKKTREEIEWTVRPSHFPLNPIPNQRSGLGLKGLEQGELHYSKSDPLVIAKSFLHLTFIDYKESFSKMNSNLSKEGLSKVKHFSDDEILIALALIIGESYHEIRM